MTAIPTTSAIESTETRLRTLPHSLEAEQAVLGGLLLDHRTFDQILEIVQTADFHHPENRLIFSAMAKLSELGKPMDIITVSEHLDQHGELETIGGLAHLAELARHTPGTSNLATYAGIVRERAVLRQLIHAAHDVANSGYAAEGRDSTELLAEAEQLFARIADQRPAGGGLAPLNNILKETIGHISELSKQEGDITGLSTGYYILDEKLSGWQPSDLIILAARPSMGKTAFAMNAVEHAVLHQDKPVIVFSLEMPAESLVLRMLSSIGRIDQQRLRRGKLEHEEWDKLKAAVARLNNRPLFIDDTSGLSPAEIRTRIRRLQREHGSPALIMIDYLQLLRVPGNKEGRTSEIGEISRSLKSIAREFNCPLMALSQLNRSLEGRANKRPINSDLRESGSIEQDADVILFIYRDEVYNEESKDKGTAELIIGKQRNGPIGGCKLAFQKQFTRFENLARSESEIKDQY